MNESWFSNRISLGFRKKLRVILQTEASECALACLGMVVDYHGHQIDLPSLRQRFNISTRGTRLSFLVEMARQLEFETRSVRVELSALNQMRLPCILHWNFNHFVVLTSVNSNSVTIIDPAVGERILPMSEMSASFTGIALEMWPNPKFQIKEERQHLKLRDLTGNIIGLSRSIIQLFLLALTLHIFLIASPFFMQSVIDLALPSSDRYLLATLAVGFGLLLILQQGIGAVRSWWIMYLSTTWNVQWRANAFSHLLQLPSSYFEKRNSSDVSSRFGSIDTIERTLSVSFVETILDGVMSIILLVMIFIYSVSLAWICIGTMLIYILLRCLWYKPNRLALEEQIIYSAKQQAHFLETVNGIQAIKLFRRSEDRRTKWLALLASQVNSGVRTKKLQIYYELSNGLLFGLENIVVIWLGASLVLDGTFSIGMLMAFLSYKSQFSQRISGLISKLIEIKLLNVHTNRLADILTSQREEPHSKEQQIDCEGASLQVGIEVKSLHFRHTEGEALLINDVNFSVAAGESIAITGPSGCGKSTLLKIILGLLKPESGQILFNGIAAERLGADSVRQLVGTVMQDDVLFEGTIAENVSFFDPNADQQWVEECARIAAIHDDINNMPMRYHTFVGYMGSGLSGGQKQRVLIARALYKRPKILFLDEATSHLDVYRELIVSTQVKAMNMTKIIVAHRPQTIEAADRILKFEGGIIVES